MKTFDEHFLEISGCDTKEKAYNAVSQNTLRNWNDEAAKRYARQCCEDVLKRAAENAEVTSVPDRYPGKVVSKISILKTEIILP